MRNTLPRFAALALSTAVAGFTITGCEKLDTESNKAEKEVTQKVAEGRQKLELARMKREEAEALPAIAAAVAKGDSKLAARLKGGSDPETIRRTAQQDLADAQKLLDQSAASLKSAADNSVTAFNIQAYTKGVYAEQRDEQALAVMQEMQPLEAQARQHVLDLGLLASQILANKQQSAVYALQNPAKAPTADGQAVLDAITAKQDEKKKEKADLEAKAAEVQKQINELKQKSDALAPDRATAEQQMAELSKQAEAGRNVLPSTNPADLAKSIEQKQKSLELTKQSLNAREKAQNLANQMDVLAADIAGLQRQLADYKQRSAMADAAVDQLNKQVDQFKAAWAQVEQQQQALEADIKNIVEGAASAATTKPAPSLTTTSRQLADVLKQLDEKRTKALALLEDAKKSFAAASTAANKALTDYQKQIGSLPDTKSPRAMLLKEIKDLNRQEPYRLSRGRVFNTTGFLFASQASLLADAAAVAHQLQSIDPKLLPEDLAKVDDTLKEAQDNAVKEYSVANTSGEGSAESDLKAVVDSKLPGLADSAAEAQTFAKYGLYSVQNTSRFLAHQDAIQAKRMGDETKSTDAQAVATAADTKALDALKLASSAYLALDDNVKKLFAAPSDLRSGEFIAYREATPEEVKTLTQAAKTATPGGPTTQGAPGGAPQDTPEVAQARTVYTQFVDALCKNDVATAKTLAELPAEQAAQFDAAAKLFSSMKKLADAVAAKFPDQQVFPFPLDPPTLAKLTPGKLNGDAVAFEDLTLTKQADGTWKVTNTGKPETSESMIAKGNAMDMITEGITAGTYATPADILKAFTAAMGGPPAPAGTPAPPANGDAPPAAPPATPAAPPAAGDTPPATPAVPPAAPPATPQ